MKMSLSHRYLNINLDFLEGFGFPRQTSLHVLNMAEDAFEDLDARLAVDHFLHLLTCAADALSEPNIAIRLGHKFRVSTYAETGSIYGYCKNLEEVIHMNDQYQKLAIDAGQVAYVKKAADENYMTFSPYYEDVERYRPITDVIMGAYFSAYHWLSWSSGEEIVGAQLRHERPEDTKAYDAVFSSHVEFGADQNSLQFSDVAMQKTLMSYNPERLARIRRKLDTMIGHDASVKSFDTSVNAYIRAAIKDGHVSSHIVADRMGLTWSAFRTSLKSGPVFRGRVDAVRQDLFDEFLAEGRSFSQIAMGLAYNDQAAMNRAFRRWYGMTPTQWKAQRKVNREHCD